MFMRLRRTLMHENRVESQPEGWSQGRSLLRSKAALLELIERGLWDDMVAEIGENRMLQPGATGDWNFKDVVAHLNGWRIGTLARLAAARDHSDPAAPP